jgi:hypothetical protein
LDAVGILVWAYVPLKVLVADVDEIVVGALAPAALPLLAYRFLFYLMVAVLVVVLLRSWPLYVGYVTLFPFVVLFWKLPRFYIRHRSWPLLLGTLQAMSSLFSDFRYNFMTKSLAFVAGVLIVTTGVWWLVLPSALYVAGLLLWSLVRRARRLFDAPSFVEVQRTTIRRLMSPRVEDAFITLGAEYTSTDLERYSAEQANQVELKIVSAIGLSKLLLLWAHQLEVYRRRYSPSVVFTLLTYVWVFFAALMGLTLLNVALLKLDPSQYQVAGTGPFIAVFAYTLSTLGMGAAGGIQPVGEVAYLLQVTGALTGILVLTAVAINLLLIYVREKDETATQELINELRVAAREQETRFRAVYDKSTDEAYAQLRRLNAFAAGLIAFLVNAIPAEPSGDEVSPQPDGE